MKKLTKKDIINILILFASFLFFVLILSKFKYYYGSTLDWIEQHVVFPEYFRDLFYKTKRILPDFAFNIGGGQNIYNFSYYGLLSPYVLFSYLLPFVDMTTYMIVVTILAVLVSVAMLYIWLKNKETSSLNCFLSTFLFIFATSMTLHSHRHIMFINYMPFLILGLFGVDRKLEKNKGALLTISVFLMIMTSYYYSIGGIVALVIYGVYKYLKEHQKITFKKFMIDGFSFIRPIVIGVLLSAIIIIPTFYTLISGRAKTYNSIDLKSLLFPNIHLDYFLYDSYGIGLTSIIILALISLFDEKKENKFLSIILSLFLIFPLFNYILNGTMYIDAKTLIPMLPICIFEINELIKKIFNKELNYKLVIPIFLVVMGVGFIFSSYKVMILCDFFILITSMFLYQKFDKKVLLVIPLCIFTFALSYFTSYRDDKLVLKKENDNKLNKINEVINYITDLDDDYYRINLNLGATYNNRTFNNFKYYSTTIYSSIFNMNYSNFYYDVINNNFPHRNRATTSAPTNIMANLFMGTKYIVSDNSNQYYGYDLLEEKEGYYIFKSNSALPIAFATSNMLNYSDFEDINYPYQSEILLNSVVVESETISDFVSNIKKFEFDEKNIETKNLDIKQEGNHYIINTKEGGKAKYSLPKEYQNSIIFIRFKNNKSQTCDIGDTYININGIKNKLTCSEWKYHNQNYDFDYVISDKNLKNLSLTFSKGEFDISNIELYSLNYEYLENIANNVDKLNITKMFDNTLEGTINVKNDGYFVTSIPYDKGFTAYVDNEKVDIEKVNTAFVGFKINEGEHKIKIVYESPLKNISIIISLVSFIIFISVYIFENKKN